MKSLRRRLLLAAVILGPACASSTEVEDFPAAASTDSDAAAPGADASCGDPSKAINDEEGSLYEPCLGHNDGSRGSCSADEICGSMPNVGYTYCMPALACPTGMVSVINLACAYPCDDASACTEHGLARCAENTLAEFTGEPFFGWCTP
jgi:hypothetical protein